MSNEFEELKLLFINNPSFAISKSQNIITSSTSFNTYQEFYSYHHQHPHISTCQKEWSTPQMSIHCADCSINANACVCLSCFLNSNHQGHEVIVSPISTGNCDCGDLYNLKPSGFCHEHQGLNKDSHPEDYLDEKLRNVLTDIVFKAAFSSLPHLYYQSKEHISAIFQFISSFLQFGDGFRRLIAISLTEKVKFGVLLNNMLEYSYPLNKLFQQLCGRLINDQVFKINFARATYDITISKIIPETYKSVTTNQINPNYSIWSRFWFHSFSKDCIQTIVKQYEWDWVNFTIKNIIEMKKNFLLPQYKVSQFHYIFHDLTRHIKYASKIQSNEQTQLFFDKLITEVLNHGNYKVNKINEMIITASFYEMHDDFYYIPIILFNAYIQFTFECFKNKKNLKIDKLIEEIDKSLDISPIFCLFENAYGIENDFFVLKFIDEIDDISLIQTNQDSSIKVSIEDHFKSFHNGGAFFYSLPLFESLLFLFGQDNLCKVKIARLLSLKKFEKTKIKLAIVALKNLIAQFCCFQSLVSKRNYSISNIIESYSNGGNQKHIRISLVFPVFQLLLGLQSENKDEDNFSIKEFFAFEMAREIGIFDDFNDNEYKDENIIEKQKQMMILFLYLSLLFNIERSLFKLDTYKCMEELIIFALKKGVSSPVELSENYASTFFTNRKSHTFLNTILSKVAKIKSNNKEGNQDVSFSLKEGIDWKSISAIVPFNDLIDLLYKEITKNSNSLLKIPEFQEEDDYFFNQEGEKEDQKIDTNGLRIKLKDFLLTPTVLSIAYYTLRMNGEKIELEDHFAMNILVLVSKFVEDFDSKLKYDSSKIINYDSTTIDLVKQIRDNLFNYEIDEDGVATIENTLNKENFKLFLNTKICPDQQEPKSLIDLLISKGEIGKSVIRKLNVDIKIDEDDQKDQQSIEEMKKQKAKKLKQSIINQYKNAVSNFYSKDIDSNNNENNEENNSIEIDEEVCSICSSTKEDENLSYPVFIYKTKLPFIFDKPPLVTVRKGSQYGVDEDKSKNKNRNTDILNYLFSGENKTNEDSQSIEMVEKRITEGNNYVIQFSICQHPIHQSCANRKPFKCPIDRSTKNGFLPCIDRLQPSSICDSEEIDIGTVNDTIIESITSFISNFSEFFENEKIDLFSELAKSIGGLISTYEIRQRNLPDCLDSSKNKALSRNLFLTTWYAYRITDKPEIQTEKLTTFQRFIVKLIQCDDIEGIKTDNRNNAINEILSSFIGEFNDKDERRKEKQIFLFLKRVCLAKYFLLNDEIDDHQNISKFIDWDEILSVSNLSVKFNVPLSNLKGENVDDFEFKPIVFAKLPKEILRFGAEPFNYPIEQQKYIILYNILDYNFLIRNFDDFSDIENLEENNQDLQNKITISSILSSQVFDEIRNNDSMTAFLMIGFDASRVIVLNERWKIKLKPFYLDNFGCTDIGFKRGKPLFLNEEKYGRIMDLILSGDFSFYIKDKEDHLDEIDSIIQGLF